MGPVLLGVSVTQINLLLDTFLASFLTVGSISWLYYSDRLVEFPLGILGAALGTVILPRLAHLGRKDGGGLGRDPGTDSGEAAPAAPSPGPWTGPCVGCCSWDCPRRSAWWPGGALGRDPLSLGGIQCRGCPNGVTQSHGLCRRPAGLHRDQGPGTRLLRPSGRAHPGALCPGGPGVQPGPEPRLDGAFRPCRSGAGHQLGRLRQRRPSAGGAGEAKEPTGPPAAGESSWRGGWWRPWCWVLY